MSTVTFYRWSLLLPIALPLLSLPLALVPWMESVVTLLAYSLLIGGIPYLLTLAVYARVFRGDDERWMERAVLQMPVVMMFLLIVCSGLLLGYLVVINRERNIWQTVIYAMPVLLACCALVLLLGYGYVALAVFLRWLFRRANWVR